MLHWTRWTVGRLHKIWGFDPTCVIDETAEEFVDRATAAGARAIMVNPMVRNVRIDRSLRIAELAGVLSERKIPLLVVYRAYDAGQDVIDWYQLADFCNAYPDLAVISWEWRSRSNRPMFDALSIAKNLRVSVSSIWQAQVVESICNHFGAYRLIFSMGLPTVDPATFHAVVSYADIAFCDKQAIASGNIRDLLGKAGP